ncbi:DEAD/DEAH box helicase [Lactobacillus amylolyticus]|uniref:DEAD/DEAH box helicase n=1 Tax=Lactobacillus amylolyticus TaxID=83683 RepID=UPI00248F9D06|nr:DEAD/DEAH box helicase [Lactobacillus amylolyticus]
MYQLFPYQQRLVNQARQKLAQGNKGVLIVSPPGSGKSVVIAEIVRLATLRGNRVMFTVHRQELINQITQTFQKNDVDLRYCTIMTVGKIANRLGKLSKPQLIITDETHHSKAKTYRKIYDYYSDVPRLGFTGSPWRLNGQGFQEIYDVMIEGPSVNQLISKNHLAPYKYFSVKLIDDTQLKKSSTGDFTNKSIDEAIGKTVFGDVVKTYRSKADGQKTIVYAHDIEYSKKIVEAFKSAGISAAHCDSKTPKAERKRIMKDFKIGRLKVLSNVDLISEGFDVPDCSCVIMLRPTESLVLFLQQSMRCMRYQPEKTATIIDHVANYTRFGMPDTPRKWSLEGWKKKKKNKVSDAPALKECQECYAVIPAAFKICPICGAEIEAEGSELEEDRQAKIEKIGEFKMTANYELNAWARKKPEDAQKVEDLYKIAKARGYKPGWAYMQAKRLSMLR